MNQCDCLHVNMTVHVCPIVLTPTIWVYLIDELGRLKVLLVKDIRSALRRESQVGELSAVRASCEGSGVHGRAFRRCPQTIRGAKWPPASWHLEAQEFVNFSCSSIVQLKLQLVLELKHTA